MSESNVEKIDSAMNRLNKVLHWLEERPSSWVILGLIIFLVSSGGVTLKIGENTFSIGEPKNEIFQAILLCLGILGLIVGLGVIASKKFKYNNATLVVFVMASIIPQYFIINEVTKEPPKHKSIREWEYNAKTNEIETSLSSVALHPNKSKTLVLVARKKNPSLDFKDDKNIVFGEKFTAPDPGDPNLKMNVSCSRLNLSIGDEVEIHLLALSNDNVLNKANTIGDVIGSGGSHIDMSWMTVVPDIKNPDHLFQLFNGLPESDKLVFKDKVFHK